MSSVKYTIIFTILANLGSQLEKDIYCSERRFLYYLVNLILLLVVTSFQANATASQLPYHM
jgi:hypothetical protein